MPGEHGHGPRVHGPGGKGLLHRGPHHVFVVAAVQQQDLDHGPGALLVAVPFLQPLPQLVVGGRELPALAGLVQGKRAGERPRLVPEHLQVVVQHQRFGAPQVGPVVGGHEPSPVEHLHGEREDPHPHGAPGEGGRHRVPGLLDLHPGLLVDPGLGYLGELEALGREGTEQLTLDLEKLPYRAGPALGDPVEVGDAAGSEVGVGLLPRGDLRHRGEPPPPEPADLPFHPALLVGPLDPEGGERGLEQVVGPERHEPVLLHPALSSDRPGHGLAEVVEAEDREDPAGEVQPPLDPVQERGLGLVGVGHVQRRRGELRAHRDHLGRLLPPREAEVRLVEVDLALGSGRVVLGHEHLHPERELGPALPHVAPDGRLRRRAPELVRRRSQIRRAVWRCLRGARWSETSTPSTKALASSVSTGRALSGRFRAGGTGEAMAWRTARRWTRYLRAMARLDIPWS